MNRNPVQKSAAVVAASALFSAAAFGGPADSQRLVTAWQFADQTDGHCELVQKCEWMLMAGDAPFSVDANVLDCRDVLASTGVVYVVEGPVSTSRWNDNPDFTISGRDLIVCSNGFEVAALPYSGGDIGRLLALRTHSRRFHPYSPRKDGLLLSNTWGDRHRFERINEQDMLRELEAASTMGVDVMQIDGGWAVANELPNVQPSFGSSEWERYWNPPEGSWNVNTNRFPNGLRPLAAAAVEKGMSLGLWYAPNCADDASAWQAEAQNVLRLWREHGVRFFKTDFMSMYSRRGFENERKFFDAVLDGSRGAIAIDLDITGKVPRLGYFGAPRCGIFVENRYVRPDDGRLYFPHKTLRSLWTLSETIDPIRLRMEFMNPNRLPESYGDSPLAPSKWPADALLATVLAASPLAWMDCVDVAPETVAAWRPLIDTWKRERKTWYGGVIIPIGERPDGLAWTGFTSVSTDGKGGYVLVFRELSSDSRQVFDLRPFFGHLSAEPSVLAGRGKAVMRDGRLMTIVPNPLDFLWVKLDIKQ